MISVELRGGAVKEFENGVFKTACACKINGKVCDLRTPLTENCSLEILNFDDPDGKKAFRHTASHILAQAVKRLYPNAKCAIGPAVDNGFYYDFDVEKPFTNDDLAKIKERRRRRADKFLQTGRFHRFMRRTSPYERFCR